MSVDSGDREEKVIPQSQNEEQKFDFYTSTAASRRVSSLWLANSFV